MFIDKNGTYIEYTDIEVKANFWISKLSLLIKITYVIGLHVNAGKKPVRFLRPSNNELSGTGIAWYINLH